MSPPLPLYSLAHLSADGWPSPGLRLYKLTHKGGPTAKMCFAYYDYDGVTQVLPPVKRAMQIAVDRLKAAGHQGKLTRPAVHDRTKLTT